MLNESGDALAIFENFRSVPRPTGEPKSVLNINGVVGISNDFIMTSGSTPRSGLFGWFKRRRFFKRRPRAKKFFNAIKTCLKKLDPDMHPGDFSIFRRLASECHQTALVERLDREKSRIDKEIKLLSCGYPLYLEEADFIGFVKKCLVGEAVRLDWIKNFGRVLPGEVYDAIRKLEDKELFDNYVIAHYDPDKRQVLETEQERELRKDPVLFGVIKHSRRLYFIADWIDEDCDLTLEEIFQNIGASPTDRLLSLSKILEVPVDGTPTESADGDAGDSPIPHGGVGEDSDQGSEEEGAGSEQDTPDKV